jgi:hypothetical protein
MDNELEPCPETSPTIKGGQYACMRESGHAGLHMAESGDGADWGFYPKKDPKWEIVCDVKADLLAAERRLGRPEPPRRYPKGSVVPEWNHYCADGHEPVASMGDRCPVCRRDADGNVSGPPRREAEQEGDASRMKDLHASACGCLDFRRTPLCMAVYKFIASLTPAKGKEK